MTAAASSGQEPMEQSGSEAVTSTDEPMQTEEAAGVRVVALDEAGAAGADASTMLQVHVAMEGQGEQVHIKTIFTRLFGCLCKHICLGLLLTAKPLVLFGGGKVFSLKGVLSGNF